MVEKTELPEAPVSVSVRGYYKGYSILVTRRGDEGKMKGLVKDAMKAIDWMADKDDFAPSWNPDTNKQINGKEPVQKEDCKHENTEIKISQSEKNPGKKFIRCKDCSGFVGWA